METKNVANQTAVPTISKEDEESARRMKRIKLKASNAEVQGTAETAFLEIHRMFTFDLLILEPPKNFDSSLKRHTALIKRMRMSIGSDNRDQILKDIESLSLEKYIDEIASAVVEGVSRCKTERDVWSATEVFDSRLMFLSSDSCL